MKKPRRQIQSSHQAHITLVLPPNEALGRPGSRYLAFSVAGSTDWGLWVHTLERLLGQMGIERKDMRVGFLLDYVNAMDIETRTAVASGLVSGRGLEVKEHEAEGSTRVFECEFPVKYEPLARPTKRLWLPGDPLEVKP